MTKAYRKVSFLLINIYTMTTQFRCAFVLLFYRHPWWSTVWENGWLKLSLMANRLLRAAYLLVSVCLCILECPSLNRTGVAVIWGWLKGRDCGRLKKKLFSQPEVKTRTNSSAIKPHTWAWTFSLQTRKGFLCDVILWSQGEKGIWIFKGRKKKHKLFNVS